MTSIITGTVVAGKIMGYGFLLGIGFWGSKKLTQVIDDRLAMYDNKLAEKLKQEILNA